jgi:uncharacterized protein (DUF302 family)
MASLVNVLPAISVALVTGGALAQPTKGAGSRTDCILTERCSRPVPTVQPLAPNTMMEPVTREARRQLIESSLAQSPFSLRQLINLMTHKVEAQSGLSWDDVIASMKQRANKINLKFIGAHPVHQEVEAITGKPTPKVAIYHFCDALLARELLDYSLEFAVLLPCRITVVEDAQQKIWLTMLDWDVSWTDAAPGPERLPDSVYQAASRLRKGLEEIIQAGASGAL